MLKKSRLWAGFFIRMSPQAVFFEFRLFAGDSFIDFFREDN